MQENRKGIDSDTTAIAFTADELWGAQPHTHEQVNRRAPYSLSRGLSLPHPSGAVCYLDLGYCIFPLLTPSFQAIWPATDGDERNAGHPTGGDSSVPTLPALGTGSKSENPQGTTYSRLHKRLLKYQNRADTFVPATTATTSGGGGPSRFN